MLTDLVEEIRRNPGADFTSEIKALAAEFREMEASREKNVIKALMLNLYGMGSAGLDARQLKRDIAKVSVFGGKSPTSAERAALLRCLYDALSFFVHGDFLSEIIETCEQIEDAFANQG